MSTIKDVARVAGVSTTTVSHVLNRTRFVSPETVEKVMQAVEALQFNLNTVARNLRASKTKMIGVLIPDLYGSFFTDLIRAIERELEANGYKFFLFHSDRKAEREADFIRQLVGYKVDGLIVAVTDPVENGSLYEWIQSQDIPIVFVDRAPPEGISGPTVTTNNFDAALSAVQHLFASYREVPMITQSPAPTPILEREAAYHEACKLFGKSPRVYTMDGWGSDVGYRQMEKILADRGSDPVGVFCVTNSVTRGAFQSLKENGIAIPDEVGLVGFDDASWTTLVTPEVTVVRTQPMEMGIRAVRRLMARLSEEDASESVHDLIDAELIIRHSSIRQRETAQ
ncbi:LacI family DNA-binding transcriptional regulator [Alicyclobacillus acidiphilus]|uniref:LacI family DNA-binding transcriptional regulator n=1 Tax=Alicyclobacillus acidiphilus TaxID=182455 RepID=UPI00083200D3|nr:LacI family DNA-binding transcriptional regulator [Alicyclobacillus acidiphilus]